MKEYKKWVITFLMVNAIIFAAITALVYTMDPLQYFRPTTFYKPIYSFQKRLVIPGIIKNHEFDSLIIGSSTAQNFKPSQVEKLFGGKCVKLVAPGTSAKDLAIFFEESAKHKDIKLVIQALDFFSYAGDPERLRTDQPEHMYNMTPTNFYKYFYDAYIIKKILSKTDWASAFDSKKYAYDHDRFANNSDRKTPSRQAAINNFFNINYTASYCGENYSQQSKESFLHNFERIARQNPDTKFCLYLTPVSILDWVTRDNLGDVEKLLEFRCFIADQCSRLDNVQLFDFQTEKNITHNLDYYYDITHFGQSVNELIISAIHQEKYLTNPQKCRQANEEIIQQIKNYKKTNLPKLKK